MLKRRLHVSATTLRGRSKKEKAEIVTAVTENVWPTGCWDAARSSASWC
ncbi:hypothetical protein [Nesterenkonia haasae]|nr:hypothetical protein [Nesterenkonia haasae]